MQPHKRRFHNPHKLLLTQESESNLSEDTDVSLIKINNLLNSNKKSVPR